MEAFKHCEAVSFNLVFVLILIYGHESWAMTERTLSQGQVVKMGFLQSPWFDTLQQSVHL